MIAIATHKTSAKQLAKNREYKKRNKEKLKIQTYRSNGLLFINKYAKIEDLEEYKKAIEKKIKEQ